MVLGRSTIVLGRSGLALSGLGGQGEPGESHQESVTNTQPDEQTNNQAIRVYIWNWTISIAC